MKVWTNSCHTLRNRLSYRRRRYDCHTINRKIPMATHIDCDEAAFEHLMDQIRLGSQEAAWDLVERYSAQVQAVVRRRLTPDLRVHFDSMDLVQAVWKSFFVAKSIHAFESSQELVAFLISIARNKVTDARRQTHYRRCDVARNVPLPAGLASSEPTPSKVAVARECWFEMIDRLTSLDRTIIEMKFMGESIPTIAEALKVSKRTVNRVLASALEKQR